MSIPKPTYMLDTDICIFIQRGERPAVLARFEQIRRGEAVVSAITFGELHYGALKSRRKASVLAALDVFFSVVPVCEMPPDCGRHYAEIKAELEKRGLPIGPNDLWIAAHAKALDATLVTNNTREFARIPHLKVENWAE